MVTFVDGPAAGKALALKRAPFLLRVTEENGQFDALNMPQDTARDSEKIYAYKMIEGPWHVHIYASPKSASGWFVGAKYKLLEIQPYDYQMRDNDRWHAFCAPFQQEFEARTNQ